MESYFKRHFEPGDWQYLEGASPLEKVGVGELEWDEQEYLWDEVGKASIILRQITFGPVCPTYHSQDIENALQAWDNPDLKIGKLLQLSVQEYLNPLAAAWGSFVEKELRMEWVRIKDEYKLTLGVWHEGRQLPIYPFFTVQRAWKEKRFTLLSETVETARRIIFG